MQDVIDWLYSGPLLTDILVSFGIAVLFTYLAFFIIALVLWIVTFIAVIINR